MRPRHKYGAKASVCHEGHKHPSKREAIRCDELHLLQACGQITNLKVEPQFYFVIEGNQLKHAKGRRAGYKPDFTYTEHGKQVAEDVKGMTARDFPLRIALFQHLYPNIELRVVK
jgi:hypothetical protein